jgi:2-polyprenyl-3-methyl-5-hydroxy-6-metoxy-1,4-benzoquinol methylase
VRGRTLESKYHLLKRATGLKRGSHLDIGAGTGAFVQFMNQRNWESVGIEPDEKARARAILHHHTRLLPAEVFETFPTENFDAISLWHVLEHVHDLYPYMHRIKNLLKQNGFVFIAVPNYTSYDARKYGSSWAAYDAPRHLYHFSPMDRFVKSFLLLLPCRCPEPFCATACDEELRCVQSFLRASTTFTPQS